MNKLNRTESDRMQKRTGLKEEIYSTSNMSDHTVYTHLFFGFLSTCLPLKREQRISPAGDVTGDIWEFTDKRACRLIAEKPSPTTGDGGQVDLQQRK